MAGDAPGRSSILDHLIGHRWGLVTANPPLMRLYNIKRPWHPDVTRAEAWATVGSWGTAAVGLVGVVSSQAGMEFLGVRETRGQILLPNSLAVGL